MHWDLKKKIRKCNGSFILRKEKTERVGRQRQGNAKSGIEVGETVREREN